METIRKVALHLGSRFRVSSGPSDFRLNLSNAGIERAKSITLASAEIINSFVNLLPEYNRIDVTIAKQDIAPTYDFDLFPTITLQFTDGYRANLTIAGVGRVNTVADVALNINVRINNLLVDVGRSERVSVQHTADGRIRVIGVDGTRFAIVQADILGIARVSTVTNYISEWYSRILFPMNIDGLTDDELVGYAYLYKYGVTIPSGNYTATQLATVVQTNLNTVHGQLYGPGSGAGYRELPSQPWTVSFDPATFRITASVSSNFLFQRFQPSNMTSHILGFTTAEMTRLRQNHLASSVTDLRGPSAVYIHSNISSSFSLDSSGARVPILAKVPVTAGVGGTIYYQDFSSGLYTFNTPPPSLDSLTFSLRDEYGQLLQTNSDWTMTLIVEF